MATSGRVLAGPAIGPPGGGPVAGCARGPARGGAGRAVARRADVAADRVGPPARRAALAAVAVELGPGRPHGADRGGARPRAQPGGSGCRRRAPRAGRGRCRGVGPRSRCGGRARPDRAGAVGRSAADDGRREARPRLPRGARERGRAQRHLRLDDRRVARDGSAVVLLVALVLMVVGLVRGAPRPEPAEPARHDADEPATRHTGAASSSAACAPRALDSTAPRWD